MFKWSILFLWCNMEAHWKTVLVWFYTIYLLFSWLQMCLFSIMKPYDVVCLWLCCFAYVGRSVCRSVRLSVGRPNGFRPLSRKHFITELSYFTCYWFWADYVEDQGQRIIFVKHGFRSFSWELFITELSCNAQITFSECKTPWFWVH